MGVIRDWIIELDGAQVGRLINGLYVEMFWDVYEVDATAEFTKIVHDPANWLSFHFRILTACQPWLGRNSLDRNSLSNSGPVRSAGSGSCESVQVNS